MYPSALVSRPHSITDVVADDADGEFLEATLLGMLDLEENIDGFQRLSTMSQVVSGNEHGPPVISGSHMQNLRPNDVWVPGEDDFLEEKDPVASASSSSSLSSENTCVPSMTLDDEYFDPEALLRELAPSTQVQATVSAPRGSHQVGIQFQPPSSGSKPLVKKIVVSVSVRLNHTHPPAAASVEELPNVGASKEQGLPLQRRPKRGRSSLQSEGRSSKVSRRLA